MKIAFLRMGMLLIIVALLTVYANAQILDSENKVGITLSDGIQVVCYGRANAASSASYGKFSNEYYYLPTNLRLAKKKDGTPQFLFVKYTTDEKGSDVQGALMHFLMEWGLTPAQESELQQRILKKLGQLKNINPRYSEVKAPKVVGPATLKSDVEGETFRIVSGTLNNNKFTPSFSTSGKAPLLPGAKIAVAALMDKNGGQLLAATFEKNRSITDVSVNLRFQYELLTPAVDGIITVDWEKIGHLYQEFTRNYKHSDKDDDTLPVSNSLKDDIITDEEKDSLMSYLEENKAVTILLDNFKPDHPVAQEVTQSFMEYFVSSVAEKQYQEPEDGGNMESIRPADPYQPPEDLYEYNFSSTKIENKIRKGTETYNLKLRIPTVHEMTITENLASWYDGVKHNKKCVSFVNLNDEFYTHREIHMILDAEAENMFKEGVINSVSVSVRKKRSKGADFQDDMTIKRTSLADGLDQSLTYARGEDKKPDVYEYRTVWNLQGDTYPANPRWQKGDWKGVALNAPVVPRTIEFEGDLEQMKEMGVRRATLQVRYQQFGREIETNIPLTVSKGQPLMEKTIYTDRATQGYVSRLILTHQREGKLAMDWESKINDDYVFAIIPDEMMDTSSVLFKKAKELGKIIASPKPGSGEVSKLDQILDKFEEIFSVVNK
ncbi:MAG: hypothetical protein AAGJ18_02485 [Bacteroidota bacterium]